MLVLPIFGDTIEAIGDVKYTVTAFAAYTKTPEVYVDGQEAPIMFKDIRTINNTAVFLSKTNIFEVTSKLRRKLDLPQPNDKVLLRGDVSASVKVKNLKLAERGNLSSGIQIHGVDLDTDEVVSVRLRNVIKIIRADGDEELVKDKLTIYDDYLGSN